MSTHQYLPQVKGAKSPLGKAPSISDKDSTLIPSASLRQGQHLSFNSNTTFRPSSLSSASGMSGMGIAAVSPRHRRDPSPAELALARQASLTPGASAVSHVDTASITMFAMSPRQRRDPSPAELAIAKQSSLGTSHDAGSQQDHAASALSPRQGRDPLAAEVAAARHKPVGSGAAATNGVSLRLNRDALAAETGAMKQSSMNSDISVSGLSNASASAISPRQRRDPSPAELALIRHQSSGIKVEHVQAINAWSWMIGLQVSIAKEAVLGLACLGTTWALMSLRVQPTEANCTSHSSTNGLCNLNLEGGSVLTCRMACRASAAMKLSTMFHAQVVTASDQWDFLRLPQKLHTS